MATYGLGKSSSIEDIFSEEEPEVSSYISLGDRQREANNSKNAYRNNLSSDISEIDIDQVRGIIFQAEKDINGIVDEIELNLKKVNINPYSNIELEKTHLAVWKDVLKHNISAKNINRPQVICFEQYLFAEQHKCRSCRMFTKEYELSIKETSFSHLLDVRKVLGYLLNELIIIKNISINYLGEQYRDGTEAQIAKYLSDWAKAASHYTKQLAKQILSAPVSIPESELGEISKKQAAQFQAFFSIKVNSLSTEIDTLSSLIKRESVDTAEVFYKNFLLPALKFKTKVIDPVMLEMETSRLSTDAPTLFREIFVANSAIVGNLGSVTTDFLERNNLMYKRFDGFLQAVRLKRRYVNYISQMESLGVKRINVLVFEDEQKVQPYKDLFNNTYIDMSEREKLRSSHNDLDDIDGDAHPQYLRRDGGIVTGDITVLDGVKIGGIDLANHTHNFIDGSAQISAADIDYQSAREQYYSSDFTTPYGELKFVGITVTTLANGVPQYEAIFEIQIDDEFVNTYEFEILYKEM
jgi:hypothetical protein